jgi:hypothetical protein
MKYKLPLIAFVLFMLVTFIVGVFFLVEFQAERLKTHRFGVNRHEITYATIRSSNYQLLIVDDLRVDENGCLRIGNSFVIWPNQTYMIEREDSIHVVHERSSTDLLVGEQVEIGGAIFDVSLNIRCAGPYLFASLD